MMAQHTLMSVLKATKPELAKTLGAFCDKTGDGWGYKKSPVYPYTVTLVAHIDTVFDDDHGNKKYKWDDKANKLVDVEGPPPRKRIYFDRKEGVLWSPEGLGADDRAGVFALLYLWDTLPDKYKPNLLFTDMEEKGALGARQAAKDILPELLSTLAMIEFDRKNSNDAVFYNDEPEDFVKLVTSFGYKKEHGSFSDISVLGTAAHICAVNLSCGYYQQHTKAEYLSISELFASINKSIPLIQRIVDDKKIWSNVPAKKQHNTTGRSAGQQWLDSYMSVPRSYNNHPASCCCQECLTQERLDLQSGVWDGTGGLLDTDMPPNGYELLQEDHTMAQRALFACPPPGNGGGKSHAVGVKHHPKCDCRACKFQRKFEGGASRGKGIPIPKASAGPTVTAPSRLVVDAERLVLPARTPASQSIDPPQNKDNIKWWNWKKG